MVIHKRVGKLMQKINLKHSVIFFNFCILLCSINQFLGNPIIVCLFLILILGVSHGALDNIKGRKILKIYNFENIIIFYSLYLAISIFIISSWLLFPDITLLLFLIVASYHFGKEDTVNQINEKFLYEEFLLFLKGSPIIIAPLFFHRDETYEIFNILNFNVFKSSFFNDFNLFIFLFLSLISNIIIMKKGDTDFKLIILIDYFSIVILNVFLKPVLAFTLYFCFLHSIRHAIGLCLHLDDNFQNGLKKFIKKAIPLTLITAILFLTAIYSLNNFYDLNEAIYKVIFIGLASLTFPHILLEYLLEKNEKKN